jgi:hypothetical protein
MNLPRQDYYKELMPYFSEYRIFSYYNIKETNYVNLNEKIINDIYQKYNFNIYFFLEVGLFDGVESMLVDNIMDEESASESIERLREKNPLIEPKKNDALKMNVYIDNIITWIKELSVYLQFNFLKAVTYKRNSYYYMHKLLKWYNLLKNKETVVEKVPVIYIIDVMELDKIGVGIDALKYLIWALSNPHDAQSTRMVRNYFRTRSVDLLKICRRVIEKNLKDNYVFFHELITDKNLDLNDMCTYIRNETEFEYKKKSVLEYLKSHEGELDVEIEAIEKDLCHEKYRDIIIEWDGYSDVLIDLILYAYHNAKSDPDLIGKINQVNLENRMMKKSKSIGRKRLLNKSENESEKNSRIEILNYPQSNAAGQSQDPNYSLYYATIFQDLIERNHTMQDVLSKIMNRVIMKKKNFSGWRLFVLVDKYMHKSLFNAIITISGIKPVDLVGHPKYISKTGYKLPQSDKQSFGLASAKIEVKALGENKFFVYLNSLNSKYTELSGVGTIAFYVAYAAAKDYISKNLVDVERKKPRVVFRLIDASRNLSVQKTSFYNFMSLEKEDKQKEPSFMDRLWTENNFFLKAGLGMGRADLLNDSFRSLEQAVPGAEFNFLTREYEPSSHLSAPPDASFVLDQQDRSLYDTVVKN